MERLVDRLVLLVIVLVLSYLSLTGWTVNQARKQRLTKSILLQDS